MKLNNDVVDTILVSKFILGHHKVDMYSGVTADEAWEAFCRLKSLPSDMMRVVVAPHTVTPMEAIE